MNLLRDMPIKRKVTIMIMTASLVSLVLVSVSLFVFQWINFRKTVTRDLQAQAAIVAANSTAVVAFEDNASAAETLAALKADPHIVGAVLYRPNGEPFVSYEKRQDGHLPPLPPAAAEQSFRFEGRYLMAYQPVVMNEKRLATLALCLDVRSMRKEILLPQFSITGAIVLAASLFAMLLSSWLQSVLTRPILRLAETARAVAEQEDYSVRAEESGNDEIGLLTGAFNRMLARIEDNDRALRAANRSLETEMSERQRINEELVEASRAAGMAEVASGVLHNIGNVLNSANISMDIVKQKVLEGRGTNLSRVVAMFKEHQADLATFLTTDPKGKLIPEYLAKLAQAIEDDKAQLTAETQSLEKNIDHIKDIINMQQSYGRTAGAVEDLPVAELIEDALRIHSGGFSRRGITLQREFQSTPPVRAMKNKVMQILVNLFRNANQAMESAEASEKILTVRVRRNGNDRVRISVSDNGMGIAPENIGRIFQHGFTTKKDGHGFGLHSSALAAKEMEGALFVESKGVGKGATFTLELPIAPSRNGNA